MTLYRMKEPPSPFRWLSLKIVPFQWGLFWFLFDILYYISPDYLKYIYYISRKIQWTIPDIVLDKIIDYAPEFLQDLFDVGYYMPYKILNYLFDCSAHFIVPVPVLSASSPYTYIVLALFYDHVMYRILPERVQQCLSVIANAPFTLFNYIFERVLYPLLPECLKQTYTTCVYYKDAIARFLVP